VINKFGNVVLKFFASIGIMILLFIIYFFVSFIIEFDNNVNIFITNMGFILLAIILISKVWNKIHKETATISAFLISLILAITIIYFDNFSMMIEPIIHLHNKYNINYSDMTIIRTTKSTKGFISSGTSRSATIKYGETEIYTHYDKSWLDNYKEISQIKTQDSEIIDKFNSIMKSYTNDYKIKYDPANNRYGYLIFLYSTDEAKVKNIIEKLDDYIIKHRDVAYIEYSIYITKDSELYNTMINYDISSIKFNYQGKSYPREILKPITGYEATRITFNDGYEQSIFINNGNAMDDEYQNPINFKQIVFWYSAEPNSFGGLSSSDFLVFGLK